MKIILCTFVTLALLRVSLAAVGATTESRSVDIKAAPAQSGPVTVHATASNTGDLRTLSIDFLLRSIDIPSEAFADIHSVDIKTQSSVRGVALLNNPSEPRIKVAFDAYDTSYMEKAGYPATRHIPVTLIFEVNPTAGTVERFITACEGPGLPMHSDFLDHRTFKLQP